MAENEGRVTREFASLRKLSLEYLSLTFSFRDRGAVAKPVPAVLAVGKAKPDPVETAASLSCGHGENTY